MAQVDATGALGTIDTRLYTAFDHATKLSSSSSDYSWTTTDGNTVTALSVLNDITASATAPTGGTISAITIFDGGTPLASITGLNVSLTKLVDTASATASSEKFWEAILQHDSEIRLPQLSGGGAFIGDYILVNGGQTRNGADDTFIGNNSSSTHVVSGDAWNVEATATLNGGDDRFFGIGGSIAGDVGDFTGGTNSGTVNGGNDTITATDRDYAPVMSIVSVVGDVYNNSSIVKGGNDRIALTNIAVISTLDGDVYTSSAGTVTGGDDSILIQRTGNLFTPSSVGILTGDINFAGGGTTVIGGNDAITLKNIVSVGSITGDVGSTEGNVTGGNDKISLINTAPTYPGSPDPMPPVSTVSQIAGDANFLGSGDTLGGGNDTITLTNVFASLSVGDVVSVSGTALVGGDDTISIVWKQPNIAFPGSPQIFGDAASVGSGLFDGGNDRLTFLNMSNTPGSAIIYGDVGNFGGTGNFKGGDDFISASQLQPLGSAALYGDASSVSTTGNFTGGNDTIIGTAGSDSIFGDAQSVTAATSTGGKDRLDGRGGNDYIDGGKGFDTAVYSSLAQAVYIDLRGIPGTATAPADRVEAIGQGNDQIVSIENVDGSSLADMILGNSTSNTFTGNGGNDVLWGRDGNDILIGSTGSDRLVGGTGKDTLNGGKDADIFDFNASNETGATKNSADTIVGFIHGEDKIDLRTIDANGAGAGDTNFTFIGTAAFTAAGQVNFFTSGGETYVRGSTDGDVQAEFVIHLSGVVTLAAGDFIL